MGSGGNFKYRVGSEELECVSEFLHTDVGKAKSHASTGVLFTYSLIVLKGGGRVLFNTDFKNPLL